MAALTLRIAPDPRPGARPEHQTSTHPRTGRPHSAKTRTAPTSERSPTIMHAHPDLVDLAATWRIRLAAAEDLLALVNEELAEAQQTVDLIGTPATV